MKIGILTFHRALNYGAVLQCYALYETLKGMGHDVEIIDYRPPYIEKYRRLYYQNDFTQLSTLKKIKWLLKTPVMFWSKLKAAKAFDSFILQHFHFSDVVISDTDIPSYYDVIIFGSDQIWSPQICEGFDPIYWGQFYKGDTIFISYAASYGGHNKIQSAERNVISKYIKSYDAISVREIDISNELCAILGHKIPIVVDPTLLLQRDVFDKLAIKPKCENYVLFYMLENCDRAEDFSKRIAIERNCQVIRISASPSWKKQKKGIILKGGLTPAEFLGYFKYANFIVSVSFHGTVFSVIFKKNFYIVHSEMDDRAFNLLKSVGLEDRLVNPDDIKEITDVNHTNTDNRITKLKEYSMSFLEKTINCNKFPIQ